MKKNYFLVALMAFAMVSVNAQFAMDDMESYGGGNTPILGGQWGSWDGSAGPALLSSGAQAQSGALSGYINDDPVTGVDALLLLGDKIFGSWGVKFSWYIPSGKVGYWNFQGVEGNPGGQYTVGNIYMGLSGIGGDDEFTGRIDQSTADETDDFVFTFPKDQWFDIIVNLDYNAGAGAATYQMWVDNVEVVAIGTPFANGVGDYGDGIGAIDLYSISADNEAYVDDVEYINAFYPDPTLGVSDLDSKGFVAYPNPVNNILNLKANEAISSVSIINILGQEVYSNASVDAMNATIDMSSYASGAYFVRVNVNGTEGIVKVVK